MYTYIYIYIHIICAGDLQVSHTDHAYIICIYTHIIYIYIYINKHIYIYIYIICYIVIACSKGTCSLILMCFILSLAPAV